MIPVLVKTEFRKASENELKLNKKDLRGPNALFRGYKLLFWFQQVTSVFPIVTVVLGFNHQPSAELSKILDWLPFSSAFWVSGQKCFICSENFQALIQVS
jgi:hypothetical protein